MRWAQRFDQARLADALGSNCGISDEQAQRCVTAVWDHITEALRTGSVIQLRCVGAWSTRPSRKPGRRNVRFKVSSKVLDQADVHRPPADSGQFEEGTMVKISQAVGCLTGTRPSRYVLENLLVKAGYDQQKLSAALTDLIRSCQSYGPQDVRLLFADVSDALARQSGVC
jgi:nucleoid DNA-binding protein